MIKLLLFSIWLGSYQVETILQGLKEGYVVKDIKLISPFALVKCIIQHNSKHISSKNKVKRNLPSQLFIRR